MTTPQNQNPNQYGPQQWGPAPQQWQAPQPPPEPPKKGKKLRWVLAIAALLVIIGMINGAGGDDTTSDTATASADTNAVPAATAPTAAAAEPAPVEEPAADTSGNYGQKAAAFGEEVNAGDMIVTAKAPKQLTQQFLGTQYCSTVTLRNDGDSTKSFSPFDWKFRTTDGVEVTANIPFNADKALNTGQLAPGGKITGQVCADNNTTDVNAVVYNPGFGIMHEVTFQ